MATLCGGTGQVQPANPKIQKICDQVKLQAEEKAGKKFSVFIAKSYTTQVVAGTNYFIKVKVDEKKYIHVRVFESLPHAGNTLQLHGIQTEKSENEAIVYF